MKPVLHRLEQISSGSLNTAVRTGVGFSLSRSFCAVQTPSKTPYASTPICWGTPWWGELKWLLLIARELLTLTGYSVTVWYSWTCQAAVWFSTSWLFHLALNWSGRVSPTPPFGRGRFDWKEKRRQALVCEWEAAPASRRSWAWRLLQTSHYRWVCSGNKAAFSRAGPGRRADTGPNVNTGP